MHSFGVRSGGFYPCAYRLRLKAKGGLHCGNRTAVTNQRNHTGTRLLISTSTVEDRARPSAKRLRADLAPVTRSLARVDADVALANLPSCGAVQVRAEYCLRIDSTPPFGLKHRKCAAIRSNFQVSGPTTV
jgi:hypothetical protein